MKMKNIVIMIAMVMVAVPCLGLPLNLNNDTILYSAGGVSATYNWDNAGTYLHWNIQSVGQGQWHYEYVWHTDGADLNRIIVEVSECAVAGDFSNWQYEFAGVAQGDPTFGWFSPSDPNTSNPGLPGSIYGFKLDTDPSVPVFGFSFDTWRSPVWGDFYAADGLPVSTALNGVSATYAYNAGFTATDANDGLHIARPDGASVPDGGLTVLLLGMSMLGVEALRRRLHARS